MKERCPTACANCSGGRLRQVPGAGYLKVGDWLLLLLSCALVAASYPLLWRGGVADRAIVKRDGQTGHRDGAE
jgi:hypothetical protein